MPLSAFQSAEMAHFASRVKILSLLGVLTLSVVLVHSAVVNVPSQPAMAASAECDDGIDNDIDGDIDYPEDSDCQSKYDETEGDYNHGTFVGVSDGLDEVMAGNNVSYTISLRTDRDVPETIDVRFYSPQGVDFINANEGGIKETEGIRWNNVVIHPDSIKKLFVTMQVRNDMPAGHLLVAEVVANGERDTDTTLVTEEEVGIPPLEIRVNDGRIFAEPTEVLRYEISVDNRLGPDRKFTLRTQLSQFLEFLNATGEFKKEERSVVWEDQFIAAGERAVYELVAGIQRDTPEFTNIRLRVSSGPSLGSDTTTAILSQIVPGALSLSVDDGYTSIRSGQKLTYEIIVRNNQAKLINDLEITNAIPTYTEFVSATEGGYWTGDSVHWKGITVSPNGQRILYVTLRVRSDAPIGTILKNSVQTENGRQAVDVTEVSTLTQGSRDTQVQAPTNVMLQKFADRTEVRPGDIVRYTIVVRNTLDHPVTNVTVEDRVDMVYSEVVDAQQGTMHNDKLVWSIPQLDIGQQWSVNYTVRVRPNTPHGTSIANVVTISGDGLEQLSLTEKVRTMRISVVSQLPPSGAPLDAVLAGFLALISAAATIGTRKRLFLLS